MSKKINITLSNLLFLSLVLLDCKSEMNFSGEWELDRQKTDMSEKGNMLSLASTTKSVRGESQRTYFYNNVQ